MGSIDEWLKSTKAWLTTSVWQGTVCHTYLRGGPDENVHWMDKRYRWMKLGGNLPPVHNALLFSISGTKSFINIPSHTDTAGHTKSFDYPVMGHCPISWQGFDSAWGMFDFQTGCLICRPPPPPISSIRPPSSVNNPWPTGLSNILMTYHPYVKCFGRWVPINTSSAVIGRGSGARWVRRPPLSASTDSSTC